MRLLALVSLAVLSVGLVGCGGGGSTALGDNGQPICLNAAQPFDYQRDTLLVSDNLERTSSWDILHAIKPSEVVTDDQQAVIDFMEAKIAQSTVPEGDIDTDTDITSFNNPIDTMEQVIANGEVGNLTAAKEQMLRAIDDKVTCSYNNIAAYLRDNDDERRFYIVRYNYITESQQVADNETITLPAKVQKVLVEFKITEQVNKEGKTIRVGNVTSTSLSAIDPDKFSSSGYNPPLSTVTDFIGNGYTLGLTKDFQQKIDRTEFKSSTRFNIGDNAATQDLKRLKLSVNYQNGEVKIFASDFLSAIQCKDERIFKDPTIETPDATIKDDDLELTLPGLDEDGDAIDTACKEPKIYYDPNYDYNPNTKTEPEPILTKYYGTAVDYRK